MPNKRTHGRPPKKARTARRPAAEPIAESPATASPVSSQIPSQVPPARAAAGGAAAAATFRRPTAMRVPAITINYAYLRHDLLTLAILAPLMVVILVVAYFILH